MSAYESPEDSITAITDDPLLVLRAEGTLSKTHIGVYRGLLGDARLVALHNSMMQNSPTKEGSCEAESFHCCTVNDIHVRLDLLMAPSRTCHF